jgi:EAL domain-containing protein (putative c-di-GMP-specific phosphodiesterase class I)
VPSWLTLEITENALMLDLKQAAAVLGRLREMGIKISVDDFGIGHSSLAYLKNLPVDEVKIDRSFVREMMTNNRSAAIVTSVIDLAHAMGLRVVAEGVEDQKTVDCLVFQGCDLAQGFLFSPPLSPAVFTDWIIRTGSHFASEPTHQK